jgi:hypothetical protein
MVDGGWSEACEPHYETLSHSSQTEVSVLLQYAKASDQVTVVGQSCAAHSSVCTVQ